MQTLTMSTNIRNVGHKNDNAFSWRPEKWEVFKGNWNKSPNEMGRIPSVCFGGESNCKTKALKLGVWKKNERKYEKQAHENG